MATAMRTGRPIYVVLGDFKHAFPNTWREALLVLLKRSAGIRGGALLLLNSMLSEDLVLVAFGGPSIVKIKQGIPEGGVIGPLSYTTPPNSLLQALDGKRCGVLTTFFTRDV